MEGDEYPRKQLELALRVLMQCFKYSKVDAYIFLSSSERRKT